MLRYIRHCAMRHIGHFYDISYLWDVRATNAGGGWQLVPVPKAAKKAFKALALTPPYQIS